ncbi:MAG: GrdX family protein [Eubacteriales bacterium]|nr:GrdX family protein [Eubacteriales bacterium]
MSFQIVTNNPQVIKEFPSCLEVEGDIEAVLRRVRDLVYEGYGLISMPLPASLKLLYSPVRSVLITSEKQEVNPVAAEIAGNSVLTLERTRGQRGPDLRHRSDYEKLDYILVQQAIAESRR